MVRIFVENVVSIRQSDSMKPFTRSSAVLLLVEGSTMSRIHEKCFLSLA